MSDDFSDDFFDDFTFNESENSKRGETIFDKFFSVLHMPISLLEKSLLRQLYAVYLRILNINDYSLVEKELYDNKGDYDKVMFEISRIDDYLKIKRNLNNEYISRRLSLLKSLTFENNNIDDKLYNTIFEEIINIELEIGMKIGLYDEVCNLFVRKVNEYYDSTYQKGNMIKKIKENTQE